MSIHHPGSQRIETERLAADATARRTRACFLRDQLLCYLFDQWIRNEGRCRIDVCTPSDMRWMQVWHSIRYITLHDTLPPYATVTLSNEAIADAARASVRYAPQDA